MRLSLKSRPVSDSASTSGEARVPAKAIHLHPTAPLAERVLLPGDPGRALALAQALLQRPAMFNHNRGLWGYTGIAGDGEPLTIQATGMGGPSAAIVLFELIALGARRAIRVGTCGALDAGARARRARDRARVDLRRRRLARAWRQRARERGRGADGGARARRPCGACRHDRQRRPVLRGRRRAARSCAQRCARGRDGGGGAVHARRRRRIAVACVLAVSDTFAADGSRTRIGAEALHAVAERMGAVALAALGD